MCNVQRAMCNYTIMQCASFSTPCPSCSGSRHLGQPCFASPESYFKLPVQIQIQIRMYLMSLVLLPFLPSFRPFLPFRPFVPPCLLPSPSSPHILSTNSHTVHPRKRSNDSPCLMPFLPCQVPSRPSPSPAQVLPRIESTSTSTYALGRTWNDSERFELEASHSPRTPHS